MDESGFAEVPTVVYGVNFLLAAFVLSALVWLVPDRRMERIVA